MLQTLGAQHAPLQAAAAAAVERLLAAQEGGHPQYPPRDGFDAEERAAPPQQRSRAQQLRQTAPSGRQREKGSQTARAATRARPGGFSGSWLDQCLRVHILPLDVEQQESVAKSRLRQPQHMHMFKQLMVRPDLQQLASNPLILSM